MKPGYSTIIAHLLWAQQAAERSLVHLRAVADPAGGDGLEGVLGLACRLNDTLERDIKGLGVGKAAYPMTVTALNVQAGDCIDLGGGVMEVTSVTGPIDVAGRDRMQLTMSGFAGPFGIPAAMMVLVVNNTVLSMLRDRPVAVEA